MNLTDLLTKMGPGRVSTTAYDTAWVARLGEIDPEISNKALGWISDHQNSDGSWGADQPYYYHDRVISTLAVMVAINYRGRRQDDQKQIKRGLEALEKIADHVDQGLSADPNGATAGFEMIVPTLVADAERLGILKRQADTILDRLDSQRTSKIKVLRNRKIERRMTAAFSLEMAGVDGGKDMLDLDHLQEEDGSVSHSPSATAYFLANVQPDNQKAHEYIRKCMREDGGAPMAVPFEICERTWVLWNIGLLELDQDIRNLCVPHLDALQQAWRRDGVGFTKDHGVKDGDDTSLTFDALTRFGYSPDINALLHYEEEDHFRCYPYETTFSISTNIHFIGALRRAGYQADHPLIQKATQFLIRNRTDRFWCDKWHASPFYATGHAIIALSGYLNQMIEDTVRWLVSCQHPDGSWGYYSVPSAEETAYALQALSIWRKHGGKLEKNILKSGLLWLRDHSAAPYPMMWLAKSLNYSEWIIQAELLSAQLLAEEALS